MTGLQKIMDNGAVFVFAPRHLDRAWSWTLLSLGATRTTNWIPTACGNTGLVMEREFPQLLLLPCFSRALNADNRSFVKLRVSEGRGRPARRDGAHDLIQQVVGRSRPASRGGETPAK